MMEEGVARSSVGVEHHLGAIVLPSMAVRHVSGRPAGFPREVISPLGYKPVGAADPERNFGINKPEEYREIGAVGACQAVELQADLQIGRQATGPS
jgi:hypothetical protein